MLNEDYRDMLLALVGEGARFLIVGAYALAAHGYPRATMDIDIWVECTPENAQAVWRALKSFGAPLDQLDHHDLHTTDTTFQIGVAPRRIDILTGVSGLEFASAYERALELVVDNVPVRLLSLEDLKTNKRASGRTKDRADLEALEELPAINPTEDQS